MARRHPLVPFFVLAFAFSWVVWAPAVFLSRGASDPQSSSALLHLLGSLGPMVSAFGVTALAGGYAGFRELLGRVFRWRVGLGWWVVAALGTPILFLVAAVISRLLFGGWPEMSEFGRSEEFAFLGYLQRQYECGVSFKSHTEPFLDTDNELIAHIVLGVTSYYAQQEALRISDRTKAGLERARKQGKVLGRPDGFERWAPVLSEMREQEFSQGRMSRETGLSYNTVKKYLQT